MYHLHHTESVRNCHADLGGQLQSGSGDMAVIRLLSQHPDPTADFPSQHRRGIHIEEHLRVPMTHLLHVLFPHHGHAAFAHGVKDDFDLSKLREHPQKAHNLAFLKIVEQASGGDQNRSIRHIGADLPDPVLSKGVPGEIGLPLRLRQQLLLRQQ